MAVSWRVRASSIVVIASLAFGAASAALAQQDESNFYKGKTVRMLVGYGPGGGYDAYARMIAPYLAKNLGASVIVENQPGAGGLTALNNLYVAPSDGLQMMIVNGTGAALAQLTEQPTVHFDLAKMGHLGTVSASPWIWLVAPNSKINSPRDAIDADRQLMWSGSGPMDGLSDGAAFACAALKLKCRVVVGYPGSHEAALAVSRGEMDSIYVSDTSANNYVEAKQGKAIAAMGRKRSRFFPNTPTIFETTKVDADGQWLFDLHSTLEDLGRILVIMPNVPPARLAVLQAAMKKTLTDPAVIAEGERSQRYVDFVDADTTREGVVKVVTQLTPEQRAQVTKLVSVAH